MRKNNYNVIELFENADSKMFQMYIDLLKSENVTFSEKLDGVDQSYFDFEYKNSSLTLHMDSFLGILLFPKKLENSSDEDNEVALELGRKLFQKNKQSLSVKTLKNKKK